MKKLLCMASMALMFTACQKKQYFESSPEIDLVKKGNDAYFKGDWATLKSVYADTAKIWDNVWDRTAGISADKFIEANKVGLANIAEYKMGENPVYEMIVTDKDEKWVHVWFEWRGKNKNGKESTSPVNVSFLVKDNKVIYQMAVYNQLPGYLTDQPDLTTIPAK